MPLSTVLSDFATRVATEFKTVRTQLTGNNQADLSSLTTSAKSNFLVAINELDGEIGDLSTLTTTDKSSLVNALIEVVAGVAAAAVINDSATNTTETWSSSKIAAEVAAVIDAAPGALDTLNELAAAIGDDANFAATITTALSNRVQFDAAQTLTGPEQTQARANIDAASATDVGNTAVDLVAVFNAALL